ncbi:glycosyltransferase [Colwelliaceae bacterium MEBiC 14330]
MNIQILICTCNDRINFAEQVINSFDPRISYLISHQVFDGRDYDTSHPTIEKLNNRTDVSYSQIHSQGLSKNRNNCLSQATSDILIFADDDVQYSSSQLAMLIQMFEDNKTIDGVTFKIDTKSEKAFKKYKNHSFKHNSMSIMKVSSIEIALRRTFIVENQLAFDERFGLGTKFPSSEENIFLHDALNKNATFLFIPKFVVSHPAESSGKLWYNIRLIEAKGALFRRLYGLKGLALLIIFALKKWPEYRVHISFLKFCKLSLSSFLQLEKK